jgi:hypothetical protein
MMPPCSATGSEALHENRHFRSGIRRAAVLTFVKSWPHALGSIEQAAVQRVEARLGRWEAKEDDERQPRHRRSHRRVEVETRFSADGARYAEKQNETLRDHDVAAWRPEMKSSTNVGNKAPILLGAH